MNYDITFTASGAPTFGGDGSSLVSIQAPTKAESKKATSIRWQIVEASQSAWGNTYLLAIVLTDRGSETSIDPGGFLKAATGNYFVPEADWTLPKDKQAAAGTNPVAGTAWVAIPPARKGCTLDIVAEDPESDETFSAYLYFYSVDIGLWWAKSSVTIPKEAASS